MADDALKFQVNLAGNLVSELVASGKAANTAEGNIQALTGAILGLTDATKDKGESFFVFDLAKGADMAIGLVETLAEKVWDLGKSIIEAAVHTQDLDVALRQNVGEGGKSQIEQLVKGYEDTRFGGHRLEQELLPLLNVGMGQDPALLKNITTAALDVAARTNDESAVGSVLSTFQRVHTRREVNARMLLAIGVNEKDFYASLGETIGKNAKQAEAEVKAGRVRAETLEAELLGLIAKREGGKLGAATDESAKTLGTTLARLERIPRDIFNDLADSPGLKAIQDRADQFIDTMGSSGKDRIVSAIGSALDRIGKDLFGDGKAAEKFITTFEQNLPKVITLVEQLSGLFAGVLKLTIQISEKGDRIWNILKRAGEGAIIGGGIGLAGAGIGAIPSAALGGIVGAVHGSYEDLPAANTGGASGGWEGPPIPQAHDFVWRAGESVQIDPADTITGAKGARAAQLDGVMNGSRGGAGGHTSTTLAPVFHFNLPAGSTREQAHEAAEITRVELARILDEARERLAS